MIPPETRQATVDYSSLTVPELKEALDEQGIEYPKNAKKNELLELLGG